MFVRALNHCRAPGGVLSVPRKGVRGTEVSLLSKEKKGNLRSPKATPGNGEHPARQYFSHVFRFWIRLDTFVWSETF